MWLHYLSVKLCKYAVLVLWVLAEGKDEVLSCIAGSLRACKEEGQTFIDHTHLPILEVRVTEQDREEVTILFQAGILFYFLLALLNHLLTKLAQS